MEYAIPSAMLKISSDIFEHSGLKFFRNTNWIQSRPTAVEESRAIVTNTFLGNSKSHR